MASSCSAGCLLSRGSRPTGVKELVDEGLLHVPARYIMPEQQRVGASRVMKDEEGFKIPVVDLSALLEGDGTAPAAAQAVEQIGLACKEWGFFQVINHGVPAHVVDRMRASACEFFDLPVAERMQYNRQDLNAALDYSLSFNPSLPQAWGWNEVFNIRRLPDRSMDGFLQAPHIFRANLQEYEKEMEKLGDTIYRAVFASLGVSKECLKRELPPNPRVIVALNYYPACPNPSLALGTPSHSDISSLTILEPDHNVIGLQVCKGDTWVEVKPVVNSFVVNVGDQIEILSNGKYKSVNHRAICNSGNNRMSIACFRGPSEKAIIAPLSELVNCNNPAYFKPTLFGDYVNNFYNTKGRPNKEKLDFARV